MRSLSTRCRGPLLGVAMISPFLLLFLGAFVFWPPQLAQAGEGDQPGACCLLPGVCIDSQTESECDEIDGIWQGPLSGCGNNNCLPGACCFENRLCKQLTAGECGIDGGAFQGSSTDCEACIEPEVACCFPNGGCLNLIADDCANAGGSALSEGSVCGVDECDQVGACCRPDGSCEEDVSPEMCEQLQGVYQGGGSLCAEVKCEVIVSACCFATEFCLLLSQMECVKVNATWLGPGVMCGDAENPCATPDDGEPSPDLNDDGVVDVFDLLLLLEQWGSCPSSTDGESDPVCPADLNQDGAVDVFDLLLLLESWGTVEASG